MDKVNNKIIAFLLAVVQFVFSIDTVVSLLFFCGIGIILFTVYSISLTAFGFALGIVLILFAVLLNQITSN